MPAPVLAGWVAAGVTVAGAACVAAAGVRVTRRARVATGGWVGAATSVAGTTLAVTVAGWLGAAVGLAGGLPSVHAITAAQTHRVTPSRLKFDILASAAETTATQLAL